MQVGQKELRARLAEVLDRVAGGEAVEITKRGEVVARILRAEAGDLVVRQASVPEVLVEAPTAKVVARTAEPVPEGQTCKHLDASGMCGKPATHRHGAQWRCDVHP